MTPSNKLLVRMYNFEVNINGELDFIQACCQAPGKTTLNLHCISDFGPYKQFRVQITVLKTAVLFLCLQKPLTCLKASILIDHVCSIPTHLSSDNDSMYG